MRAFLFCLLTVVTSIKIIPVENSVALIEADRIHNPPPDPKKTEEDKGMIEYLTKHPPKKKV